MMNKNAVENNQFTCSATCSAKKRSTNRIKCNDATIRHLKPKEKRTDYYIVGHAGFGVRVTPKGTKSWIFTYTFNGQGGLIIYGRYPKISLTKARQLYLEDKKKLDHGIDPNPPKESYTAFITLNELVERYKEFNLENGKKSWRQEYNQLKKYLLPKLGSKKAHLVTDDDLMPIFNYIIFDRKAKSTATHLYSYVRRLFNFAANQKINKMKRRDNPCLEIKLDIKHKACERHLQPWEIYLFWKNIPLANASPLVQLACKFMLCTAVRGIEVRQFKWEHLDNQESVWLLPNTKNGTYHRIHLGRLAKELLCEAKKLTGGTPFVFGYLDNSSRIECLTEGAMAKAIHRSRHKLGIKERFTPHDLRRTSATLIAALFGDRSYVKRALNHVEKDATSHYDQYIYDREKKIGSDVLNFALERIVNSSCIENVPTLDQLRDEAENSGILQGKVPNGCAEKRNDVNQIIDTYSMTYTQAHLSYQL
jgi:integrase